MPLADVVAVPPLNGRLRLALEAMSASGNSGAPAIRALASAWRMRDMAAAISKLLFCPSMTRLLNSALPNCFHQSASRAICCALSTPDEDGETEGSLHCFGTSTFCTGSTSTWVTAQPANITASTAALFVFIQQSP